VRRGNSRDAGPVNVSGSVVLVTGASGGIGRAAALVFAHRGALVKATGRDGTALEGLAAASPRIEVMSADLTGEDGVARVADWAGPVDVLVNNAGAGWAGRLADMDEVRIDDLVALNLRAPMRLTRALLPGMLARGRGRVVNVASVAAHVGPRNEAVYAATKWGLAGFTESLRAELAGSGVGVTLVSPGVVRTAFFERQGTPYARTFPRPIPPERVARATVGAVERDADDVFEPRWMVVPARLRGAWPRLYRSLASRFE